MTCISSSFFGRFISKEITITVSDSGIEIRNKHSVNYVKWEELPVPPQFHLSFFGQILSFNTHQQGYAFGMRAYRAKRIYQQQIWQCWANVHIHKVERLLAAIEKVCTTRYLRQSHIISIQAAANKTLAPWLSFMKLTSKTTGASDDVFQQVQQLSHYIQWSEESIHQRREFYIEQQLIKHQGFFDSVEANPLTLKQRRACIIDNNNNLLLAGAGTGKTSVMVGRTGYLMHSQQATHAEILLLAYGRKAANEMDERIQSKLQINNISATTFHSLGLGIIAKVEGKKPSLSVFAEDEKAKSQWVQARFEQLMQESAQYRTLIITYFSKHYYVEKNDFDFKSLGERHQYYNDNDIRTLKGERVKSFGELHIANGLFTQGITYEYEAKYAHDVATVERRQYQPDFYLPELNSYIEYYGVDEHGGTAPYINNAEYHASIEWKRSTHTKRNTHCIELTYAAHKRGQLLSDLNGAIKQRITQLTNENETLFQPLSSDEILATLRNSGKITVLSNLFTQLIGLYKAACLDSTSEQTIISNSLDSKQTGKAFELLKPIVSAYEQHLNTQGDIDFEDMINKALAYVQSGQFTSPWRYIMVDEFQDISEPRARLVKALRDNNNECSVFAVGDDWQAIYRFSGANVRLTTHFAEYFGATTQSVLDQTFRFNNKIGEVATQFISKNPAQISKVIQSLTQVSTPAVSLLKRDNVLQQSTAKRHRIDELENGAINDVLKAISAKVCRPVTVYILARYWFLLPDKTQVNQLNSRYPLLTVASQSFHAAKGKEADYVIIVGLTKGAHGFPSEKVTPALVDVLLAKQEVFDYAEERRLFYVALTRAKHKVYLIADMTNASCFVSELIEENNSEENNIECNEFASSLSQTTVNDTHCLVCKTGVLKKQTGRYGAFYGCSHFPRCDHKEQACEQCESPMTRHRYPGFKVCLNDACKAIVPTCSKCNAEMVLRSGKNGEFWGCRNYKGNESTSCKNGITPANIQWPKQAETTKETTAIEV